MDGEKRAHAVTYDRFWGFVLLLTCLLPAKVEEGGGGREVDAPTTQEPRAPGGGGRLVFPWQEFAAATGSDQKLYRAWLVLGTAAGLVALLGGFLGRRAFRRHAMNLLLGGATTALLAVIPSVHLSLPFPAEASRPLDAVRALGPMVLAAAIAAYAGAGMRIARPGQVVGQAMGGLGALLLGVAFFLPGRDGAPSLFTESVTGGVGTGTPELVSRAVLLSAAFFGAANLVRTRGEIFVARVTRLLLVGGFLYLIGGLLWFEVSAGRGLREWVLPYLWAAGRALGPLFLCVDGLVALFAIMITHGGE